MSTRLTPYGAPELAGTCSKVGKSKTPLSLAALMPTPEVAAKVGPPIQKAISRSFRVSRRNAHA